MVARTLLILVTVTESAMVVVQKLAVSSVILPHLHLRRH
jgi:hypothetical protein